MDLLHSAIPKDSVSKEYPKLLKRVETVYLCGQAGYGKTITVAASLKAAGIDFVMLSAAAPDFEKELDGARQTVVVVDDEQALVSEDGKRALLDAIARAPKRRRFLILSRRMPMPYLKTMEVAGRLVVRGQVDLLFDLESICALLERMRLPIDAAAEILRRTDGYAAAIRFAVSRLSRGERPDAEMFYRVRHDVYELLDSAVMAGMPGVLKNLMLRVSPFERFTPEMARMLTGEPDVMPLLAKAREMGSYLDALPNGEYGITPAGFRAYLQWKLRALLTPREYERNLENAGLYYELSGDLTSALECYQQAGNAAHLGQLLERVADRNPGHAHFSTTKQYYRALPESVIVKSPELMAAMSMMCSIYFQPDESERWFRELEAFCRRAQTSAEDRARAEARLWYLRIGLPHRGTVHIQKLLLHAASLVRERKLVMQSLSVSGNMPSIINGGKDFSHWTRHDRLLYRAIRGIAETALRREGVGLSEITLAESLFEKNGATSGAEVVMLLNTGICNAEARGVCTTVFAGTGVMARLLTAQGQSQTARDALKAFEGRAEGPSEFFIRLNLRALDMRIRLMEGDVAAARTYLDKDSPSEEGPLLITNRYAFLTRARCYMALGLCQQALALLSRLEDYFIRYHRTIGQIECRTLMAICLYRLEDDGWRSRLAQALNLAKKYAFVQTLADEGAALLELLEREPEPADAYLERIYQATAQHAKHYPKYLANRRAPEALRGMEIKVLRLLSKGLKNSEIGEALHLSPNTVKSYLKSIYMKLGVHSRVEAFREAQRILKE